VGSASYLRDSAKTSNFLPPTRKIGWVSSFWLLCAVGPDFHPRYTVVLFGPKSSQHSKVWPFTHGPGFFKAKLLRMVGLLFGAGDVSRSLSPIQTTCFPSFGMDMGPGFSLSSRHCAKLIGSRPWFSLSSIQVLPLDTKQSFQERNHTMAAKARLRVGTSTSGAIRLGRV